MEKNYNKKKYPISIACGVIHGHPQLLSFLWVLLPLAVTVEGGRDGGDGTIHVVYW